MALAQEAIGEVRMVDRIGKPKYLVKINGKMVPAESSTSPNKPIEIRLGWLVRVLLRTGEPCIITGVVKRK